jgi:hypothetical protein
MSDIIINIIIIITCIIVTLIVTIICNYDRLKNNYCYKERYNIMINDQIIIDIKDNNNITDNNIIINNNELL